VSFCLKENRPLKRLYQLEGVVFSLDKVSKTENGENFDLGDFIEIRTTDKELNEEKIKSVIHKMGLDINTGIKESYFEM